MSTLLAAFETAGLTDVICPDCNYTLFAPTNDAFAAVDQEFLTKLLTPEWTLHLASLLSFHATKSTPERVVSTDLADGLVLSMLNDENVTVNIGADGVVITSEFTEGSQVLEADIIAENGVVHKVNSVLIPEFAATDLVGLGATAVGSGFTILFEFFEQLDIGTLLTDDYTVFAPTDAAFLALGNETLDALRENSTLLTGILVNHVLAGVVPSVLVTNGLSAPSLGGLDLIFATGADGITVNDARVVATDVLANNGIVHAIDAVLLVAQNATVPPSANTTDPGADLGTVDEIILQEEDLSTLAAAFDAAGLVGVICPDCNFTLFAPTNDAFAAVDQDFLTKLLTAPWVTHLVSLLSFHATTSTTDRVLSTDLVDGLVLSMMNAENVTVDIGDSGIVITSEFTTGSTVVEADLQAENGVVHKVGAVLLPEFVVTDIAGLGNTSVGADFTILFELLSIAEIVPDNCTVFAPTDAAFAALGNDVLDSLREDKDTLVGILVNHVVAAVVPSVSVTDGLSTQSLGDLELTFAVNDGTVMVNDATVVVADVLANNGIVHAIDKVLLMAPSAPTAPVAPTASAPMAAPKAPLAPKPPVASQPATAPTGSTSAGMLSMLASMLVVFIGSTMAMF